MTELKVYDGEHFDMVAKLEEMLTHARAGKISAIAIATTKGDEWSTCFSTTNECDKDRLLGAVAHLQYRLHRRISGD